MLKIVSKESLGKREESGSFWNPKVREEFTTSDERKDVIKSVDINWDTGNESVGVKKIKNVVAAVLNSRNHTSESNTRVKSELFGFAPKNLGYEPKVSLDVTR